MKVHLTPGKYVLAVSGGVDSMALLDILRRDQSIDLVVAHFNHGIREDSGDDENLVASVAQAHHLNFEVGYGNLGEGTSEEEARVARYRFLRSVKNKHSADALITAHHQDDLIETAFINILRGSGHRGLVSIRLNSKVLRPLLNTPKSELVDYAKKHRLSWREDTTNDKETYLRNYVRKNLMPKLTNPERKSIINRTEEIADIIAEKEKLIATISQNIKIKGIISRARYVNLPQEVRHELLMDWLRAFDVKNYDRKAIEKLDIYIKTGLPGRQYPVKKGLRLQLQASSAQLILQV